MKFDKKVFIEKVCSKDKARPALMAVHYNKAHHRLEASDGFGLCILAVADDEQDEDAMIGPSAIAAARKLAKHDDCELHTHGATVTTSDGTTYKQLDGKFPDVQPIVEWKMWDNPPFLAVSAEFLKRCADALGATGSNPGKGRVALRRNAADGPLLVTSLDVPNAFVIQMTLSGQKPVDDGLRSDEPVPDIPPALRGKEEGCRPKRSSRSRRSR